MRLLCRYAVFFNSFLEGEQFKQFLKSEQDWWRKRLDLDEFTQIPYFSYDESYPIPNTEYTARAIVRTNAKSWDRIESYLDHYVNEGFELVRL